MISESVPVPVIASGGAGTVEHIVDAFTKGKADAALIATMVHSGNCTIARIKQELDAQHIPVRL